MKRTCILFLVFYLSINGFTQTNITNNISFQSRSRLFIIHLPPGFSLQNHLPLVFVLHGGSGNASGTINFTQYDKVSDTAGFIAVFPQGGAVKSPGYSWADGRGTNADSLGIDDVGFISALIDFMYANYKIDTTKVYATGISNGGFMCQRLACELSPRLTAIASVAATMDVTFAPECHPQKPLPLMIINGTMDPMVPYEGGVMSTGQTILSTDSLVSFWRHFDNCSEQCDSSNFPDVVSKDNSTVSKYIYNKCDSGENLILYKIVGGGHTWPGVPNKIYEIIAGHTNEDIHASVETWNFFNKYKRKIISPPASAIHSRPSSPAIFPNPSSGIINIENGVVLRTEISDFCGRYVQTFYGNRFDIGFLPDGIYLLTIHTNDNVTIKKISLIRD